MSSPQHYSVLLQESVDALVTNPSGIYVDGTFGRGGHSRAILERLNDDGRLIGFDKDVQAIEVGNQLAKDDPRFRIVHNSFASIASFFAHTTEAQLRDVLQQDSTGPRSAEGLHSRMGAGEAELSRQNNHGYVDGILLDLGVSSPQLDQAERGFSFLHDGPLDMRMNTEEGLTAAEWIASASESDIAWVLREYGEERFARRMAAAVVKYRQTQAITSTLQLAKIIAEANPKWEKGKNPATRAFQAIRIYINKELDDLDIALQASLKVLKPQGRLVVISFHSLEDRMVKRFMRDKARGKEFPIGMPVTEDMLEKEVNLIGKAVKAGKDELDENIRSRSAVMRIAEKR